MSFINEYFDKVFCINLDRREDRMLLAEEEFKTFGKWLGNQHFMGCWMSERSDRYQLFDKEYYWSKAFNFFQTEYYGGCDWEEVHDKKSREYVAKVSINAINHLWEEEFDRSKHETLSFLKPSALLVEKMNLKQGDEEGTFVDGNGRIVCFSAEAIYDTKAYLLVRKKEFLEMLEANNLKVAWTLLGEKGVMGGSLSSTHNYGRIEFSGAFFVEGNNVKGKHKTYSRR